MDLKIIEISAKDGKGKAILADQAHHLSTARMITIEFPIRGEPPGDFAERETRIVAEAQAVLDAASGALKLR
jgi:hypothetical protein